MVLAAEGRRDEARAMLDEEPLACAALAFPSTFGVAEFYAMHGDVDQAIQWLERAVRNGDARTVYFRRSAQLASIRSDPRFVRIVESVESGAAERRR